MWVRWGVWREAVRKCRQQGRWEQKQHSVWQLVRRKQAGVPFYWAKWGVGPTGLQPARAPWGGAACRRAGRLQSMGQ